MTIVTPKKLRNELSAVAKAAYPNEIFAFLLGEKIGETYNIQKLYFPQSKSSTKEVCFELYTAIQEAFEEAGEDNLTILGDVHSHPGFFDASPSEHDWDNNKIFEEFYIKSPITGILAIFASKGKLRTRLRYWPWIKKDVCQKSL